MKQLVITAVGPDRPGLVDEISGFLLEAGANLADSRMVNLRGQFALILLAEVADDAAADKIEQTAHDAGEKIGLDVFVQPDESHASASKGGLAFHVSTYAMDQPGIVHRITHLLHERGVNIEELQTRLEPGSYTGTPQFSMELTMTVPQTLPVKQLRADLEALCESLNCDIDIEPAD
jgi:glycine cleavage system transcriptional repressor